MIEHRPMQGMTPEEELRAAQRKYEALYNGPHEAGSRKHRELDLNRKSELFAIAKGIAAQLHESTRREERCLVRSMVEMLLEA